jgi:hypothetical protein
MNNCKYKNNHLTIIVEKRKDRDISSSWPFKIICPNLRNCQYPGEEADIATTKEKELVLSFTNKSLPLLNIHYPYEGNYVNSIRIICQEILKADTFEIIDRT